MIQRCLRNASTALSLLLLLTIASSAQTPGTGAIQGTVFDPSGRTVTDALISVQNEATHASRSVATDASGVFTVPLLTPGAYSLTVKVTGFDEKAAHSVPVVVSETRSEERRVGKECRSGGA